MKHLYVAIVRSGAIFAHGWVRKAVVLADTEEDARKLLYGTHGVHDHGMVPFEERKIIHEVKYQGNTRVKCAETNTQKT